MAEIYWKHTHFLKCFKVLEKWVFKPNIPTNCSIFPIFTLFFPKFGCSLNNMLLLLSLRNVLNVGIFQFFTYISPLFRHNYFSFFIKRVVKRVFFSSKLNNCSFLSWRDGREMFKGQALFHDVSNYWEHW